MSQIAFQLDKASLIKIGKGALIAVGGAAGIALLQYFGALKIDNPVLASLVAWVVPVGINFVKEWMAGEKPQQ